MGDASHLHHKGEIMADNKKNKENKLEEKELKLDVKKKADKKPVASSPKLAEKKGTSKIKTSKTEEQSLESNVESQKSKTAKAGKHSKKAILEAEAKAKKEAHKKHDSKVTEESKPKPIKKPHVVKYSKNQKAARALIEPNKLYDIKEAIILLPKLSKTKFDATAEVHISLSIDTKQSEQNLRTSAALPAGSGQTVRIAVIAGEKDALAAKKAGADLTDDQDLLTAIGKGKFDFDVLIATPEKMSELGRHAKVLGPKGLMPSPKNGTVTNNPSSMVEEIKRGRAEIKNDSSGNVHVAFGKLSFKPSELEDNLRAVLYAVKNNKPNGVKGVYIKSIYITSSMSPSIKLDTELAFKKS